MVNNSLRIYKLIRIKRNLFIIDKYKYIFYKYIHKFSFTHFRNCFTIEFCAATENKLTLAKGTQLISSSGELIKIEDIQVNDELASTNGNFTKVMHIYTGKSKLYKIMPISIYNEPFYATIHQKLAVVKNNENTIITIKDYLDTYGLLTISDEVLCYRTPINLIPPTLKTFISKIVTIHSNMSKGENFLVNFLNDNDLCPDEYVVYANILINNKIDINDFLQLIWRLGYQARLKENAIYIKKEKSNTFKFYIEEAGIGNVYGIVVDPKNNFLVLKDTTVVAGTK